MELNKEKNWIEAAVLIPYYKEAGEEFIILTKRTDQVLHHKGQICFPGGARDDSDHSLWETALRETKEEMGLDRSLINLIREMEQQFTPTGFRVTPFLGQLQKIPIWKPNPHEIAEIFSVPFSHLRDPRNFRVEEKIYQGQTYLDPHYSFGSHIIWGMTGRIIQELISGPR